MSSSFNQPMAVERGRSHELIGSMVEAVYVHVLRTLIQSFNPNIGSGQRKRERFSQFNMWFHGIFAVGRQIAIEGTNFYPYYFHRGTVLTSLFTPGWETTTPPLATLLGISTGCRLQPIPTSSHSFLCSRVGDSYVCSSIDEEQMWCLTSPSSPTIHATSSHPFLRWSHCAFVLSHPLHPRVTYVQSSELSLTSRPQAPL